MHSLADIAPTIACILRIPLNKRDGKPVPEIIRELEGRSKLLLLIMDGFGWNIYKTYCNQFGEKGMVFRCRSVSMHTTPSIATILTGLCPGSHGVFDTLDTYRTEIQSVVELASLNGISSAVIMEKNGARSFEYTVDLVVEIEEDDAARYDLKILEELLKAAAGTDFVVAHFRILDRYYHESKNIEEAVMILSSYLKRIMKSMRDAGIIICGDHPPHNDNSNEVPLIAICRPP